MCARSGSARAISAPEAPPVQRVTGWFHTRGAAVEPFAMVDEDVTFRLPVELRRELQLAESQRA